MKRLESSGLVTWSTTRLSIKQAAPDTLDHLSVANIKRLVPVPRRTIRMLCQVGKPAVMASVEGHLLRDLYYRGGEVVSWGRVKSSWTAAVFDVSLRAVKAANAHLMQIAWLIKAPSSAWATKRHGGAYVVNLAWSRPDSYADGGDNTGNNSAPEQPQIANGSAPCLNRELPSEQDTKTSNPIRATGVSKTEGEKEPPTWRHVERHDLTDSSRLLKLFESARRAGAVGGSEHERFSFFAAAEHALVHGKDPCALFVNTVKLKRWKFLCQDDEDAARQRLNRALFGARDEARRVAKFTPAKKPSKRLDLTHEQKLAQAIAKVCHERKLLPMVVIRSMNLAWTKEQFENLYEQAETHRFDALSGKGQGHDCQ